MAHRNAEMNMQACTEVEAEVNSERKCKEEEENKTKGVSC